MTVVLRPRLNHKYLIISVLFTVFFQLFSINYASANDDGSTEFNPGDMIMHHVTDSYEWHLLDIAEIPITLPLPVILYAPVQGLDVFSSSKFHHGTANYNGYGIDDHGHVYAEDGRQFYNLSITKNVAALFLAAFIMVVLFLSAARGYKTNPGGSPKGLQSWIEPLVVYIKDEVVKPNIGPKYQKYLPYMLTLFFFIWFGNLLGLLPGAANLTGNIAVTMVLAVFTLILTLFSSNRNYWSHIFNPPGVPLLLKPIIIPIEILGVFTKPFSLMLRLFVAITAGHIVILSLIALAFIFHSWVVGLGTSFVILFINLIEILVATIQAYVFTLFSSMYIGMAVADEHH